MKRQNALTPYFVTQEKEFKSIGFELLYHHVFLRSFLPQYLSECGFTIIEIAIIELISFSQTRSRIFKNEKIQTLQELLQESAILQVILADLSPENKIYVLKEIKKIRCKQGDNALVSDLAARMNLGNKLRNRFPDFLSRLQRGRIGNDFLGPWSEVKILLTDKNVANFEVTTQIIQTSVSRQFIPALARIKNRPLGRSRTSVRRFKNQSLRSFKSTVSLTEVLLIKRLKRKISHFSTNNLQTTYLPFVFYRTRAEICQQTTKQPRKAPDYVLLLLSPAYCTFLKRAIIRFQHKLNFLTSLLLRHTLSSRRKLRILTKRSEKLSQKGQLSANQTKHRRSILGGKTQRGSWTTKTEDRFNKPFPTPQSPDWKALEAHPLLLYFTARFLKDFNLRNGRNVYLCRQAEAHNMLIAARLIIWFISDLFRLSSVTQGNYLLSFSFLPEKGRETVSEREKIELLVQFIQKIATQPAAFNKQSYSFQPFQRDTLQELNSLSRLTERAIIRTLISKQIILRGMTFFTAFKRVYIRKIYWAGKQPNRTALDQIGGLTPCLRQAFAKLNIPIPHNTALPSIKRRSKELIFPDNLKRCNKPKIIPLRERDTSLLAAEVPVYYQPFELEHDKMSEALITSLFDHCLWS